MQQRKRSKSFWSLANDAKASPSIEAGAEEAGFSLRHETGLLIVKDCQSCRLCEGVQPDPGFPENRDQSLRWFPTGVHPVLDTGQDDVWTPVFSEVTTTDFEHYFI
jgi:hypothetical protein